MNKNIIFLVLALGVCGYAIYSKQVAAAGELPYLYDLNEAQVQAQAEAKPILLVFGGPW